MFRFLLPLITAFVLSLFLTTPVQIFAQTSPCPSIAPLSSRIELNNGLLTARGASNLSTSGNCIVGTESSIPHFSLPSYQELKSIYFTQSKLTKNSVAEESGIRFNELNNVAGDLNITQAINIPANKTTVIFVDGNLNFLPTNPANSYIVQDKLSSALTFVVGGNVGIGTTVTQIDATIVTSGKFCTAASDDGTCPLVKVTTNPLTINGSVISLSSDTDNKPKFMRELVDNTSPAEIINFQPKFLILLKDIFAKDLTIWGEIQ